MLLDIRLDYLIDLITEENLIYHGTSVWRRTMNFHSRRRQHGEKICRPDGVADVGTNRALSGERLVGNSFPNLVWHD